MSANYRVVRGRKLRHGVVTLMRHGLEMANLILDKLIMLMFTKVSYVETKHAISVIIQTIAIIDRTTQLNLPNLKPLNPWKKLFFLTALGVLNR